MTEIRGFPKSVSKKSVFEIMSGNDNEFGQYEVSNKTKSLFLDIFFAFWAFWHASHNLLSVDDLYYARGDVSDTWDYRNTWHERMTCIPSVILKYNLFEYWGGK